MALRHIVQDRLRSVPPLFVVSVGPLLLALFVLIGPFVINPIVTHSGFGVGVSQQVLPGPATMDPNIAITSFALGTRAALEMISGHLPLWNHFQGLGAPLLGEMQSAALFPPSLLLLLPRGQALEHLFLQWLAGVGAYLFFRRFGLGVCAAVIGAVLYEFNGVFASLRNAAFNPVAFLPWLLFGVEALRAQIQRGAATTERLTYICMTAAAAALALYAGFPETTYLYSFLVVGWALLRLTGLRLRAAVALLADLGVAAALALAISAPLMIAFFSFLAEGHVGGHGDAFVGSWQEKETGILYFLPYLYGTFLAASDARLAGLSISTGGYVALAPAVLALAALCTAGHRGVKIFLSVWIFIALGVSHGWPIIYPAAMTLPLMKLAVAGRYLNASWIFCSIFLAALMIDRLPQLESRDRRRCAFGALAGLLLLLGAATWPALEMIPRAWENVRPAFLTSILGGSLAAATATIALLSPRLRTGALVALLGETFALFLVPFFANPRTGEVDRAAIAFLRENVGFQRVAKTDGAGMAANFGAAIGVPLIHFDDLPSPRRTVDYVRKYIDPYADNLFLPEHPALPPQELSERRQLFKERLPAYAQAGVKYVMASPDFTAEPALHIVHRDEQPAILDEDQRLRIEGRWTNATTDVDALTVRVGTFGNATTGQLAARLCAGEVCVNGAADLSRANDGGLSMISFDTPLNLESGIPYTLEFEKRGAARAVIWAYPQDEISAGRILESPNPVPADYGIELAFVPAQAPKPVHISRSMAIYALANVRAYASAPGCEVTVHSFDEMETSCPRASSLLRLNVHMAGWRAEVNGNAAPIGMADDTFQSVDLPAGRARVTFHYAPPGFAASGIAAIPALLFVMGILTRAVIRRRQNSADAGTPLP